MNNNKIHTIYENFSKKELLMNIKEMDKQLDEYQQMSSEMSKAIKIIDPKLKHINKLVDGIETVIRLYYKGIGEKHMDAVRFALDVYKNDIREN